MTVDDAIEAIRDFDLTYEDTYKDASDIERLLEAALVLSDEVKARDQEIAFQSRLV